jgi:hypothetical protein
MQEQEPSCREFRFAAFTQRALGWARHRCSLSISLIIVFSTQLSPVAVAILNIG